MITTIKVCCSQCFNFAVQSTSVLLIIICLFIPGREAGAYYWLDCFHPPVPFPALLSRATCLQELGLALAPECRRWTLPFLSPRFPLEWYSDRTCSTIGARNHLQCGHQLWSLQDYLSDLQLWKQGHILLCPCCGTVFIPNPQARSGQTTSSHFRDSLPDEQRPAAEVCPVFDYSAPHRSLANCSKASRWNPFPEFRNQPSSWWVWQMMSIFSGLFFIYQFNYA